MKKPTWRKRFYARWYERVMAGHERFLANRKQQLFHDLPQNILEIGAGVGANLPYLPCECQWTGIEPNPFMCELLSAKAEHFELHWRVQNGSAERLDAADESVDAVISTLVLCSVARPDLALTEIHRVLKPASRLYFVEHVAAPTDTWLRRSQRMVRPLWKWMADGCHPDRETEDLIRRAGFDIPRIERVRLPIHIAGPFVAPHIIGVAVKAA